MAILLVVLVVVVVVLACVTAYVDGLTPPVAALGTDPPQRAPSIWTRSTPFGRCLLVLGMAAVLVLVVLLLLLLSLYFRYLYR